MKKIFVTGSTGFVGKALCLELQKRQLPYIAGVRTAKNKNELSYGDFTTQENWESLLQGVETVIHLAARVHVMKEESSNPLQAFMEANCNATQRLALAAQKAGVRRFIFISSVKVNGEATYDKPFTADDTPAPQDPYGVSKMEAERALLALHRPGQFEVVVIRPPLIYGPGVKANFKNLMWLVEKDLPIPFGRVDFNKRSMVSVYNLIDLIILCTHHPKASGHIFMASDDHDLSLKDLLIQMGKALRKTPHFLPVPVILMKIAAKILGKNHYSERLFGNLQVDIAKTKELLNWKPEYSFNQTMMNMCHDQGDKPPKHKD